MAVPPIFVSGQVLTAAQMNKVGMWTVIAKTSFSAVSNFGAANVFTSDYDDYLLVVRATTSSTTSGGFQLTISSTPASTLYSRQVFSADNTTLSGSRSTAQANLLGIPQATNGSYAGLNMMYISKPALATPTLFKISTAFSQGDFLSIRIVDIAGMHETATAYDGWSINMAVGTTTGDYTLYGLNKQ